MVINIPCSVVKVQDGAILLEWTSGKCRVGINLEKNPEDSGWYWVDLALCLADSGFLSTLDPEKLFKQLLDNPVQE